ncbi:hypothetical protein RI367_003961 [Sorochytrium milnesiophthora]
MDAALFRLGNLCMVLLGPVLVIAALFLITMCAVVYFKLVIPSYTSWPGIVKFVLSVLSIWITALCYFNYVMAIAVKNYYVSPSLASTAQRAPMAVAAGTTATRAFGMRDRSYRPVPSTMDDADIQHQRPQSEDRPIDQDNNNNTELLSPVEFLHESRVSTETVDPQTVVIDMDEDPSVAQDPASSVPEGWRYCRKCSAPKPPRCHHCSICNRCVLKMDHHCPWLARHNNHRYFVLFLVYISLACIVFSIMALPLASDVFSPTVRWAHGDVVSRQTFAFAYLMAAVLGCALSGMAAWHVYLVLKGKSQLEFMEHKQLREWLAQQGRTFVNPHDLGWRLNLRVFLNVSELHPMYFAVLPYYVPALGDGTRYPSIYDYPSLYWEGIADWRKRSAPLPATTQAGTAQVIWQQQDDEEAVELTDVVVSQRVISASTAAVVGAVAGYPFDSVKTRMQTFYYPSISHCFRHTYATEGVRGFYRGIAPTLVTVSFTKSLSFTCYVRTKNYLAGHKFFNASSIGGLAAVSFLGGAVSGTATSFITQPLELIKVLRQLQELVERERKQKRQALAGAGAAAGDTTPAPRRTTMLAMGTAIVKQRGMIGLYHGFGSHYLRESFGSGVYFTTYELSKRLIQDATGQPPGVLTYFMSGAMCGAFAWVVIFPLDVVKSSIQRETLFAKRRYHGFVDCVKQLYLYDPNRLRSPSDMTPGTTDAATSPSQPQRSGGSFKPFFRGMSATMIRAVPIHALNWVVYEGMLRWTIDVTDGGALVGQVTLDVTASHDAMPSTAEASDQEFEGKGVLNTYGFTFGLVGGIALCVVVAVVALCCIKRRRRRKEQFSDAGVGRMRLKRSKSGSSKKSLLTSAVLTEIPDLDDDPDLDHLEVSRMISKRQIQLAFPTATAAVASLRESFSWWGGGDAADRYRSPSEAARELQNIAMPAEAYMPSKPSTPQQEYPDYFPSSPTLSSLSASAASTMPRHKQQEDAGQQLKVMNALQRSGSSAGGFGRPFNPAPPPRFSSQHARPPLPSSVPAERQHHERRFSRQSPSAEVSAVVGQAFSYLPPFVSQPSSVGDQLRCVYVATLTDDSPLPAWLTCHRVTGRFNGIPYTGDAGILHIRVLQIELPPAQPHGHSLIHMQEIQSTSCDTQIGVFTLSVNEDDSLSFSVADFMSVQPSYLHGADLDSRRRRSRRNTTNSLLEQSDFMLHLGDEPAQDNAPDVLLDMPLSPSRFDRAPPAVAFGSPDMMAASSSASKRDTDLEWERWIRSSCTHATLERELRQI